MTGLAPLTVAAALACSVAAMLVIRAVVPPPARLRDRLRPYLGRSAAVGRGEWGPRRHAGLLSIAAPMVEVAAARLGRLLDSASDEAIALRLRQARMFDGLEATERVAAFRMRQLGAIVGGAVGASSVGVVARRGTLLVLLMAALGIGWGATFWRGRVGAAIEERRRRLRIELSTIDQILAMRIMTGGGVVTAVRETVSRGRGAVVDDLDEALRSHRGGTPAGEAFRRVAAASPEPHAQRTYRLLATAEERGSDLADALLASSHDIRDDRRDALRRTATKRRAAMLVPIVALLAPVLVMFVAAPLPWVVFGELR